MHIEINIIYMEVADENQIFLKVLMQCRIYSMVTYGKIYLFFYTYAPFAEFNFNTSNR
jgi:hypothetical protein